MIHDASIVHHKTKGSPQTQRLSTLASKLKAYKLSEWLTTTYKPIKPLNFSTMSSILCSATYQVPWAGSNLKIAHVEHQRVPKLHHRALRDLPCA